MNVLSDRVPDPPWLLPDPLWLLPDPLWLLPDPPWLLPDPPGLFPVLPTPLSEFLFFLFPLQLFPDPDEEPLLSRVYLRHSVLQSPSTNATESSSQSAYLGVKQVSVVGLRTPAQV